MRGTRLAGLLLAITPMVGCVDQRYFAPRENRNGTGPEGHPAAVYPFESEDGAVAGELRIWSHGAVAEYSDDPNTASGERARVEVHVGFELENTGHTAIDLGGIHAEPEALALVRIDGETRAAPGVTAKIEAWFLVPEAESTRDVPDFSIRHEVLADGDVVVTQITPFGTWAPRLAHRDWDPFLSGPSWRAGPWASRFGAGWAWGFGAGAYCW